MKSVLSLKLPDSYFKELQDNTNSDELKECLENDVNFFLMWEKTFTTEVYPPHFLRRLCTVKLPPSSRKEILLEKFSHSETLVGIVLCYIHAYIILQYYADEWKGWFQKATQLMYRGKLCAETMTLRGLHGDHLIGVKYLHGKMLELYMLRKGKVPRSFTQCPNDFESLPDRAKAFVLGTKAIFIGGMGSLCQQCSELSVETMKQVVRFDPPTYIWHCQLGNWLRSQRKRIDPWGTEPSELELKVLYKTYLICQYNKRTEDGTETMSKGTALSQFLEDLAEVVKYRRNKKQSNLPLKVGTLHFEEEGDIVDYIHLHLEKFREADNVPFAEALRVGNILSNILPHMYRDYNLAKTLLTMAHRLCPSNSKASHKLGILYVNSKQHRDMKKAATLLGKAVASDSKNVAALMDYINTLIHGGKKNTKVLEKLYKSRYDKISTEKQKSQVRFSLGCFCFLVGDRKSARQQWVEAYNQDKECCISCFMNLPSTINRYGWDSRKINLNVFLQYLEWELPTLNGQEREIVQYILSDVKEEKKKNRFKNLPVRQSGVAKEAELSFKVKESSRERTSTCRFRTYSENLVDFDDNWRK